MTRAPSPERLRGEGALPEAGCAVVLVRVAEGQFHLGLGRGREPRERVLHLAWHRILRDEELARMVRGADRRLCPAAVITLALDPLVEEALRVLAGRVARRPANTLAYGFGEVSATFDRATGEPSEEDAAFTCATFVLAMLRSVGVLLVDGSRWREPSEEDRRWQERIGEQLLAWIETHLHGELLESDLARAKQRVERDLGARRYRPTDVAGAALLPVAARPAGAAEVDPRAAELVLLLPWPYVAAP